MSTLVLSANDKLREFTGSEMIYKLPLTNLSFTEGVRAVAKNYGSYWFLDIIASYQRQLEMEDFQVWKLERDYSFTTTNNVKSVVQRKDSFKVTCEDGNSKLLIEQNLEFSDFEFDEYKVWVTNNVILLPSEY